VLRRLPAHRHGSESQLSQCAGECVGQQDQGPGNGDQNDSKSDQLRQKIRLSSVGIAISDKTTDAYSHRCCAFHNITGKGQSFGRKRFYLKVTRLLPFSGKTRTGKSQIVSTNGVRSKLLTFHVEVTSDR